RSFNLFPPSPNAVRCECPSIPKFASERAACDTNFGIGTLAIGGLHALGFDDRGSFGRPEIIEERLGGSRFLAVGSDGSYVDDVLLQFRGEGTDQLQPRCGQHIAEKHTELGLSLRYRLDQLRR